LADLWLLWTRQRLGQPMPDSLREHAATDARGDWQRPALAVMAGKLTPEEMLKLVERKSGDERRTATSEAYFYLGQYYMGRGDKIKASEFFGKVRRLNMVMNTEHKAAGFELQYLGTLAEASSPEASAAGGKATGSLPVVSATAADRPPANVPGSASVPPKTNAANQKAPKKAPQSWTSGLWKLW